MGSKGNWQRSHCNNLRVNNGNNSIGTIPNEANGDRHETVAISTEEDGKERMKDIKEKNMEETGRNKEKQRNILKWQGGYFIK